MLVVSHERSGTYFLMNTLAAAFDYVAAPWLDFTPAMLPMNFHDPAAVALALATYGGQPLRTLVKSHHETAFFAGCWPAPPGGFRILYIHREPAAALHSLWRLLAGLPWREGPVTPTLAAFLRAAPEGGLMRFQMQQYPSMVHRWAAHVGGWLDAADACPAILPLRYEDLDRDHAGTVARLGDWLGLTPRPHDRPARDQGVVKAQTPVDLAESAGELGPGDHAFITDVAGPVMARCGYAGANQPV